MVSFTMKLHVFTIEQKTSRCISSGIPAFDSLCHWLRNCLLRCIISYKTKISQMEVLQAVVIITAGEILLKQAKQLLFYKDHIPARTCNWQEPRLEFSVKKISPHENTQEAGKENGNFGT